MRPPLLAVSRTETNQITIFEVTDSEREVATISVSEKQPFGLAFDEPRRSLYAACWNSAKILAIDLGSLKVQKEFSAGRLPAWATRREGANEIWVSNEGAGVVTILDTQTGRVAGEIATGRGPSDIAFTDSGRYAWVTNEKDANVSWFDAGARRKIRDIRVGKVPQGMTLADGGRRLLVANFGSNSVSVIDTATGKELSQIAVGRGPVDVVCPGSGRAWVTCFSGGVVSVIDIERGKQTERIVTGGKPQGIEAHPNGERVYVAVRDLNELVVLSCGEPSSGKLSCIVRRIKMSGGPARMVIAP